MTPDIHMSITGAVLRIDLPENAEVLALTIAGASCAWSFQKARSSRRVVSAALTCAPRRGNTLDVSVSWSFHGARFETRAGLNGPSSLVEEWQETTGPYAL